MIDRGGVKGSRARLHSLLSTQEEEGNVEKVKNLPATAVALVHCSYLEGQEMGRSH